MSEPQNNQLSKVSRRRDTADVESDRDDAFWRDHGAVGMVWSNPNASDSVMIYNAMLKQPSFHLLLDIACRFGLARLKSEWNLLQTSIRANGFPEEIEMLSRVTPIVSRCISHMEAAIQ
jgi:hypothetical protein